MNITQLMQYISPELICQVVYPQNIDYLDIRLLCGAETEFINNCIYLGSLANISASLYQDMEHRLTMRCWGWHLSV